MVADVIDMIPATQAGMAPAESGDLVSLDSDNVLAMAEQAEKRVDALNKIMQAAIRITTEKDWVLIGGTPYLQESGATKVARLFGIGWKICDGWPKVEWDAEGYPTYTYRMEFTMGNTTVECEGGRSARDDFFAGARKDRYGNPKKQKSPDEIDMRDVKLAAYTNCLNNGIKRILPGLRNLDVATLEAAGLNLGKARGYTFREGSKGGAGSSAEASGLVCSVCGAPVSQKVASFSQSKFGRILCMEHQKNPPPAPEYDGPTYSDADVPPERG